MDAKNYLKYFTASLCLSFSVLAVFMAVIVSSNSRIFFPEKDEINGSVYLPDSRDCFNILIAFADERKPFSFMAVNFNPVTGKIPVTALPSSLFLKSRNCTLQKEVEQSGIKNALSALNEELNFSCEKYICLNQDTLDYIISLTDNITINLKKKVQISEHLTLSEGKNILNGSLAFELVKNSDNSSPEILSQLINNLLPFIGESIGERCFNYTVNNCDVNISYADYQNIIRPCQFLSKLSENPAFPLVLQGKVNNGVFNFTDSSEKSFAEFFRL